MKLNSWSPPRKNCSPAISSPFQLPATSSSQIPMFKNLESFLMPLSRVTSTIRKWLNLPDIQTLTTCCHLHWLALGQAPSCLAWLILTFSLFVFLYPSCPPNHMAASEWFLISFVNQIIWSLFLLQLFQIQSKDLYHNLQASIGNNGKKWSLYSSAPLLLPLPFLCLLLSPHPILPQPWSFSFADLR